MQHAQISISKSSKSVLQIYLVTKTFLYAYLSLISSINEDLVGWELCFFWPFSNWATSKDDRLLGGEMPPKVLR